MRLIDADALASALNNGRLEEQTGRAVPFNAGVAFALTMVEYAPTIDAVPRWIPCEERLPEEEGWYLVTIQNDKTEKRRTENDLFAIGIAEAHKLTPYKFCKDGHRQTVIAWMPLPEPYKGERKDDE